MSPVEKMWTTNAAGEEVGCSRSAYSSRFHAGARELVEVLMGSFSPEAEDLRMPGPSGKTSCILVGESGGGGRSCRKCEGPARVVSGMEDEAEAMGRVAFR